MKHNALLLLISIGASFLLLEGFIRLALFSPLFHISVLKEADRYGSYFSDDDHWKLYYRFGGRFQPPSPSRVHPLLGWSQTYVEPTNPLGLSQGAREILKSGKKKILFYGDSFVSTSDDDESRLPFYLNVRLPREAVVDLSCGGYGIDQMFLMFQLTHQQVSRPGVIFGLLLYDDLDRAVLSVRTGQKPFFALENNTLFLRGMPIDPDPVHYYATHPPEIYSYAFRLLMRRLFTRNSYNVISIPSILDAHFERINEKKKIFSKILEEICRICEERNYPLLFVLFYEQNGMQAKSWQESFVKERLAQSNIPYVDTKVCLIAYASKAHMNISDFYMPGGHHNHVGNTVIAEYLLQYLNGNAQWQ